VRGFDRTHRHDTRHTIAVRESGEALPVVLECRDKVRGIRLIQRCAQPDAFDGLRQIALVPGQFIGMRGDKTLPLVSTFVRTERATMD
jgi:hypothetical protein